MRDVVTTASADSVHGARARDRAALKKVRRFLRRLPDAAIPYRRLRAPVARRAPRNTCARVRSRGAISVSRSAASVRICRMPRAISKTFSGFTSSAASLKNFRQRRYVRGQHRRAVRHGLERRQARSLRRAKGKGTRARANKKRAAPGAARIPESARPRARATHHRAPQVGMPRQRFADHQQLQVSNSGMIAQLLFGHGKGFDQARQIFLRLDVSGVEHEGRIDRVALQDAVGVGGHRLASGIARRRRCRRR